MINQKFRQRFGKKKCICFDDREKEYRDLRKGDRKKVEKKKWSGLKVVKNARTYFEDNDRLQDLSWSSTRRYSIDQNAGLSTE